MLIAETQINGNFYRRLDRRGLKTGLIWKAASMRQPERAAP